MSLLDEALERQLRKILPLPKPAAIHHLVPTPQVGTIGTIDCRWHLAYQEGTSDKEYIVEVVMTDKKFGYEVYFMYGRRGRTLQKGTKTSSPVRREDAVNIAMKLVAEKKAKGYKEI